MDYAQQLNQAQIYFQQHQYLQSGQICGVLLEQALRQFYQQLLHELTLNELQTLRLQESKQGSKRPGELGLGQLLGLYQQCRLWPYLQTYFGFSAQRLQELPYNFVVQLRNRIVHHNYLPRKSELFLALATLAEFLVLTELISESVELEWHQNYSPANIYSDILALLPLETRHHPAIAQKLDDIAINLKLTLAELRQLQQTPDLKTQSSGSSASQSYAGWMRRSKSAVQYAQNFFAQLKQGAPALQIDFSRSDSIHFCVYGMSWMHLTPSIQGFIVYLPDPKFSPPGPSDWFLQCQKVLKNLSLTWIDLMSKIEWDEHYDNGQHPIRLALPVDLLTEADLLEMILDNYDLFCAELHKVNSESDTIL